MPKSFSKTLLFLSGILISSVVFADNRGYQLSDEDKALINRSIKMIDQAKTQNNFAPNNPPPSPELINQVEQLLGKDSPLISTIPRQSQAAKPFNPVDLLPASNAYSKKSALPFQDKREIFILVSRSMPDSEMKAALEEAVDMDAVVVFRGLNPGENIKSAFLHVHRLMAEMKDQPTVEINPMVFSEYKINSVPAIIVKDSLNAIWANGILNTQWLIDRFDRGDRGNQGVRGSTHNIVENDMIEEIRTRMSKLDFNKMKEDSYKRYWEAKDRFLQLPPSNRNTSRDFNPSVVITQDIVDQNGKVLVKAGSLINPTSFVPLTKTVVVFDATNKDNLEFVDRIVRDKTNSGKGVILMTTMLDKSDAWNQLERLQARFGHTVALLNREVRDRFGIQSVPSTIEYKGGKYLRVSEFKVGDVKK